MRDMMVMGLWDRIIPSDDTTVLDVDGLGGLAVAGAALVHLLDHVLALDDLPEDDVLAVEPGGLDEGDEELAAVGVGAGIGHRQQVLLVVDPLEVLVLELLPVDRLPAGAVLVGEVSSLGHEVGDDAVEGATLVAEAQLTGGQLPEVVGSLGHDVVVELEDDAAGAAAADVDVEEHVCHS